MSGNWWNHGLGHVIHIRQLHGEDWTLRAIRNLANRNIICMSCRTFFVHCYLTFLVGGNAMLNLLFYLENFEYFA